MLLTRDELYSALDFGLICLLCRLCPGRMQPAAGGACLCSFERDFACIALFKAGSSIAASLSYAPCPHPRHAWASWFCSLQERQLCRPFEACRQILPLHFAGRTASVKNKNWRGGKILKALLHFAGRTASVKNKNWRGGKILKALLHFAGRTASVKNKNWRGGKILKALLHFAGRTASVKNSLFLCRSYCAVIYGCALDFVRALQHRLHKVCKRLRVRYIIQYDAVS